MCGVVKASKSKLWGGAITSELVNSPSSITHYINGRVLEVFPSSLIRQLARSLIILVAISPISSTHLECFLTFLLQRNTKHPCGRVTLLT